MAAGLPWVVARGEGLRDFPLIDQASEDATLVRFLDGLRTKVAAKNYQALEAMMLPDFRVEFDTGKGRLAFHKHWAPQSHESPVWAILNRLLSMGGTFYSKTLFALPYAFARFPNDLDPLAHVVVVKEKAALRTEAKGDGEPIGYLTPCIAPLAVPLEPPVVLPTEGTIELDVPERGRCFIDVADVYSPAGHRAFFEKRAGQWRWISLAAATLAEPPDLERLKKRG